MNKVELIGRLTRDPDNRMTQSGLATGRFTLAVDRKVKKEENQQTADFIGIVVFGKTAEFVEKYFRKGMKVAVCGRIQTGSYTRQDGQKVYTTDVIGEEVEFCEKKEQTQETAQHEPVRDDGFIDIPDNIDAELPFK